MTDRSDPPALSLAQWRTAERARLRQERLALSVDERVERANALASHLDALLQKQFGQTKDLILSAYWPIKAELDLRPWMEKLHGQGVRLALPVVEIVAAPLVFRAWAPGMKLEKGVWGIPVPPPQAVRLHPQVSLAPLVGWDGAGFRLGYGGGYFDRTLAALVPRPFVIGVGLHSAKLATIHPQSHDIPLNAIVTEQGLEVLRG